MKIPDMIQVLQDAKEGKDIEAKFKSGLSHKHWSVEKDPCWDFSDIDYRSVPKPKRIWVSFHDDGPEAITLPPDAKDAEFYSEYIEYTDIVRQKLEIGE